MNDYRLRFALIGTGDFGRHFAPYITEVAELVAVCDPLERTTPVESM